MKAPYPGQVSAIWFMMSLDRGEYHRTIYGFFDLLGDVGGLNDILFLIGSYFFAFF